MTKERTEERSVNQKVTIDPKDVLLQEKGGSSGSGVLLDLAGKFIGLRRYIDRGESARGMIRDELPTWATVLAPQERQSIAWGVSPRLTLRHPFESAKRMVGQYHMILTSALRIGNVVVRISGPEISTRASPRFTRMEAKGSGGLDLYLD
ncbi:MAG: hypothetical protein JNK74_22990 [Candidatus Hydrogenedentes bacterium]|nr:hypothetical protein [Candidatus Hydrogenedentota bacterium]